MARTMYVAAWVVRVIALALILLYIIVDSSDLCSPGESSCFRDWLSASGGVLAIVAAGPTVYLLKRQIARADHHHRVNVMIQFEKQYQCAVAMRKTARQIIRLINGYFRSTRESDCFEKLDTYEKELRRPLRALLEADVHNTFRVLFFFTDIANIHIDYLRVEFSKNRRAITARTSHERSAKKLYFALSRCRRFCKLVQAVSDQYIKRVDRVALR